MLQCNTIIVSAARTTPAPAARPHNVLHMLDTQAVIADQPTCVQCTPRPTM